MTDSQSSDPVAQLLLDPQTHRADGTQRVEVRETHISRVFLTRRYAYKQKKPVKFDFLDFSTLEKRAWACQQEVDLNRRLAPDVYLGRVPVVRQAGGRLMLGGDGEVIEWLVHMRRVPDERSMLAMLRSGTVSPDHIGLLRQKLLAFYQQVAVADIAPGEYVERFREHIQANFEALRTVEERFPDCGHTVRRPHQAQLWTIWQRRDELAQRVSNGCVIDGHGDLRPEHVYFLPDPIALDCIEFNPEFRKIDAADELSFLAMECDAEGATWIESELFQSGVSHPVRQSDDGAATDETERRRSAMEGCLQVPVWLLRFYQSYRACVRAKVTWLRYLQLSADTPDRQRLLDRANRYLALADRYAQQFHRPVLIVMRGRSGTGKSTLAKFIAAQTAADVLTTDAIRKSLLADTARPTAYGEGAYTRARRHQIYDAMFKQAERLLGEAHHVILDGTFLERALCDRAVELAGQADAKLLFIETRCHPATVQARLVARQQSGDALSDATVEIWKAQADEEEELDKRWPHIVVDTTEQPAIDNIMPMVVQTAAAFTR